MYICIYIYIYVYIHMCMYIYIYVYREVHFTSCALGLILGHGQAIQTAALAMHRASVTKPQQRNDLPLVPHESGFSLGFGECNDASLEE